MQSAHGLSGIARPPAGKAKPFPIFDQHPQRETVPRPPRLFCFCGFLPHQRGVHSLGNLAMTAAAASRALASARAEQERHAPFLAVQRILAEVGSAAARRHAHGKAALRIVAGSASDPRTPSGPRGTTWQVGPWQLKSEGARDDANFQSKDWGPRRSVSGGVGSWQRPKTYSGSEGRRCEPSSADDPTL